MNLLNHGNKVEKLHTLLIQQKTGTSKTLAERLGNSKEKETTSSAS